MQTCAKGGGYPRTLACSSCPKLRAILQNPQDQLPKQTSHAPPPTATLGVGLGQELESFLGDKEIFLFP